MKTLLAALVFPAMLLCLCQAFVTPQRIFTRSTDSVLSPLTEAEETGLTKAEEEPELRLVRAADSPLDSVIDFMLSGPIPQIISQGKSEYPVPDFSLKLDSNLGNIFKVSGSVSSTGGTIRDVTSLYRQGSSVLTRQSNGVLLFQVAVGVRNLRISYSKYNAVVDGARFSGEFQATVSPAVMSAQVQLISPCSMQLKALSVSQLGNLAVKVTGLPKAYSAIPKIVEGLFDHPEAKKEIGGIVVSYANAIVAKQLRKLSCQ